MSGYWPGMGMGLSAESIAYGNGMNYPHDPSDLRRCMDYVSSRQWSTQFLVERMASKSVQWERLTQHWDFLVALLREEIAEDTGVAPRTYQEMKRVLADGVACETCDGTGHGTPCLKCKGTGRRSGGRCRAQLCYGGHDFCIDCRGYGYTSRSA